MSMIIAPTRAAIVAVTGLFGLLFKTKSPKLEAQRLGELSAQTAKEGEDRARVYGICRPIGGNVMYMSQPIKRMVKTYVGKAGGKGGGKKKKQYQDVEHVYRYYAISVCEGPITGFRRIWRNGALVYDARKGSEWGAKNNHLFFQNYRLYTGSWDQMPDSMLQARWGMDIPAHRGTAYLVSDNEDLTDFGGAIPQWQFEVVRSEGFYLTSRPYNLETIESGGTNDMWPERGSLFNQNQVPELTETKEYSVSGGSHRKLVFDFSESEESETKECSVSGGSHRKLVFETSCSEESETKECSVSGGSHRKSLIRYMLDDSSETTVYSVSGGSHSTNNPTLVAPTNLEGVYSE